MEAGENIELWKVDAVADQDVSLLIIIRYFGHYVTITNYTRKKREAWITSHASHCVKSTWTDSTATYSAHYCPNTIKCFSRLLSFFLLSDAEPAAGGFAYLMLQR